MIRKLVILGIVAALAACSGKDDVISTASPKPAQRPAVAAALPLAHPPLAAGTAQQTAMPPVPPASGSITGRVLETMNSGGYTYIRVGTPAGDQWTAVRETKLRKGSTVAIDVQMVAENFESKTLHRKFERITFGTIADGQAQAQPPAQMSSSPARANAAQAMGTPAQHMTAADARNVSVEKAEGGRTIAEAWRERVELKGKPVIIRGKVVKFLAGIMGKNWLHLRDGSGSREKGDDDITVTTLDHVNVGDIVTVSGTLLVDKDFGAGYQYPVIIEDAKVQQ